MKLLYIDLFCGAGGTSTGVENARYEGRQCAKVIGCVNHDANAIASHAANHPDALHFTESLSAKMQDDCTCNGCRMSAGTAIDSRIGFSTRPITEHTPLAADFSASSPKGASR